MRSDLNVFCGDNDIAELLSFWSLRPFGVLSFFFCVLAVRQHGLSRYPFRAADQSPHGHLGRLLDVATVLPPGIVQQGLRALEASQVI